MGDLTKNLSRWELACECGCGFDCADIELCIVMQKACDHFSKKNPKVRIHITGGNRCRAHNRTVRGAVPNSYHIYGKAADWYLSGVTPSDLYKFLDNEYPDKYGIILYHNRVHLDVRKTRYREIK